MSMNLQIEANIGLKIVVYLYIKLGFKVISPYNCILTLLSLPLNMEDESWSAVRATDNTGVNVVVINDFTASPSAINVDVIPTQYYIYIGIQ